MEQEGWSPGLVVGEGIPELDDEEKLLRWKGREGGRGLPWERNGDYVVREGCSMLGRLTGLKRHKRAAEMSL